MQTPKTKEPPALILPGTLQWDHKVNPFRPSSGGFPGFNFNTQLHASASKSRLEKESRRKLNSTKPKVEEMVDAETGETIRITQSVWSNTEGRINIDMPSVLGMGTGSLHFKARIAARHKSPEPNQNAKTGHSTGYFHHPLVEKSIKEGPLTPIHHVLWNPKTPGVIDIQLLNENNIDSENDVFGNVDVDTLTVCGLITHSAANSDIARRSGSHDRSHHHVLFDDHIASRDGYHDNTHHHHRSPRHDIAHHHHPNPGSPTHRDGGMSVSSHSSHSHSLISETLDTSNKLAWKQVEQRIMHEISAIAFPLERNKQWTGEKPVELMTKQRLSMEKICRTIAKLRTKSLMQVIDAIKDDEERDKARQEAEYKCTKKSKLQELKEKHEKERHDHRTYLRTLQYNNEVILINKMNEFGLLW